MNPSSEAAPLGPATPRFAAVDLARGAAIVGVVLYHFGWDLSFLGFIATDVARDPLWRTAARLLAGTFLFLVGVSLVLAHRNGFRPRAFWRRFAIIAAAAAAISLATYLVFPQTFIFFGILHAIALFSVLALPFIRLPLWLTAAAGLTILLAPLWLSLPALDPRWLAWIGLVATPPATNDYVPIFPWFGVVLLGVASTRAFLETPLVDAAAAWRPASGAARRLIKAGRWSLVIYLVHQPLLLALLYPATLLVAPQAASEPARFVASCAARCATSAEDEPLCERVCACAAREIETAELWSLVQPGAGDAQRARLDTIVRQCLDAEARPGAGDR